MIAYPASLPCVSRVEGFAAAVSAGLVRTPMEAGNTRQRRSQRVLPTLFSLVFMIEQDELATWLAWVNAYAWDTWVLLNLPGNLASRAGANTTPTPVRFASDLQQEFVPGRGLWWWRVRVSAEWLPLAGDLVLLPTGDSVMAGTPDAPSPDWILAGTPDAPSVDVIVAGE